MILFSCSQNHTIPKLYYTVCHGDPVLLLSYCKEHWDGTYVYLFAHVPAHVHAHTHTMYLVLVVLIISTLLPSPFITLLSPPQISFLHTYPRSFYCSPLSYYSSYTYLFSSHVPQVFLLLPPILLFILHLSLFFTRTLGLSIAPLSASDRKEVMSISHRWFLEDFDVVAFAYTPVHNHVRLLSSFLRPCIVIISYWNIPYNLQILLSIRFLLFWG